MQNAHMQNKASLLFGVVTLIIGIVCIIVAAFGIFWLSKIIPGLYSTLVNSGFSFMSNTALFHILWAVFFLSLLITGIKLIISALNKRTKDLVPGLSLYFLGASLVVIGLFYFVFGQLTYALLSVAVGILSIYIEGTTEIA